MQLFHFVGLLKFRILIGGKFMLNYRIYLISTFMARNISCIRTNIHLITDKLF
jgi:hypothetical protein